MVGRVVFSSSGGPQLRMEAAEMASLRELSRTVARTDTWGCQRQRASRVCLTTNSDGSHTAQCRRQWTAHDHAVEMGSWAVPGLWSAVVLEVIWTWGEEGGRAEGRL